jgi:hypothetical protein
MKSTLMRLFLLTAVLMASLFLALAVYDFVEFRPYRHDIEETLRNAHPLHKHPPKIVSDMVDLSEGRDRIKPYVARRLLARFELTPRRMLWRHTRCGLWAFLIGIHYSDQDILTFWLDLAPYKGGKGLNASANWHYGRNLDQLGTEEIARIITIVRSPSLYERDTKRLEEKARNLQDRINGRGPESLNNT